MTDSDLSEGTCKNALFQAVLGTTFLLNLKLVTVITD